MNGITAVGTGILTILIAVKLLGWLLIDPIVFTLIVSFVLLDIFIGRLLLIRRKRRGS